MEFRHYAVLPYRIEDKGIPRVNRPGFPGSRNSDLFRFRRLFRIEKILPLEMNSRNPALNIPRRSPHLCLS
jgi:hypothetical protein